MPRAEAREQSNDAQDQQPNLAAHNALKIQRRVSRQIFVGSVAVGGEAGISVQSMTNTITEQSQACIKQILELEKAGADIVRVSCPNQQATEALAEIVRSVNVPIVADIHFHYKRAIEAAAAGAACLRINPGNIGSKEKVREVVKAAKDYGCSIRIGVNAGSLERELLEKYREPCPQAMLESALAQSRLLEDCDFINFKISVKASDVRLAIASYRLLAEKCDHPLHLGITEAGGLMAGSVKSAVGIGCLLLEGIGDTMRVSLSADPVEEVRVAFAMLQALKIRSRGVNIIACPSCARQQFDVIKVVQKAEQRLEHIREPITVSIIGCVVNGPGEARSSDVGVTGGGRGTHQIYVDGKGDHRFSGDNLVEHIVMLVEKKVKELKELKELKKLKNETEKQTQ